jgi:hypothetical protein
MPRPSLPHWLDQPNNIWCGAQNLKILQILTATSSFSGPNTFLSTLLSNILSACSFLNLRDQVSQPTSQQARFIYVHVIPANTRWRYCDLKFYGQN